MFGPQAPLFAFRLQHANHPRPSSDAFQARTVMFRYGTVVLAAAAVGLVLRVAVMPAAQYEGSGSCEQ